MAEGKDSGSRRKTSGSRRSASRNGSSGLTGREAVAHAREQLTELMGRPVEAVLGMQRDDDGWVVIAQVVELARVPTSTDVLGEYAVTVDSGGEVTGYQRMRRYHRSQADGDAS